MGALAKKKNPMWEEYGYFLEQLHKGVVGVKQDCKIKKWLDFQFVWGRK